MFRDESNCMTTYAPYPEVPTAAVLPVDDCVIAPPVTATSTVFRTPNCPTIRWEASRCREPSARAFAVRWTSGMDTRVIGDVLRSGLAATRGGRVAGVVAVNIHARPCACGDQRGAVVRMGVRTKGVSLARSQRPRICSEGDVRHGSSGDRQRS